MKKMIKRTYEKVGREVFVKGLKNGLCVLVGAVLMLMLWGAVACSAKREEPVVVMYELTEEQLVFETSSDNPRLKVPRVKEVTYLVTEVR